MVRHHLALTAALLALTTASQARAGESSADVCITHNDTAISLRKAGKLQEARAEFIACADKACPAAIRSDCEAQLAEVRADIPTIVFELKDAAGHDIDSVTVTVDDAPLKKTVDGTELEFDPGKHLFTFTAPGVAPVTGSFVLRVGDKHRHERIALGPSEKELAEARAATSTAPVENKDSTMHDVPPRAKLKTGQVVGLVLGGAGVLGLAVGATFGAMGFSEKTKQLSACSSASSCPDRAGAVHDHSLIGTDSTIADIGIIAGAALVAAGAVVFFTGGGRTEPTSGRLSLIPAVGPGGSGVLLCGEF